MSYGAENSEVEPRKALDAVAVILGPAGVPLQEKAPVVASAVAGPS